MPPCAPGSLAFSKPGDWDGQSKQRVPISLSLVPDPSTIRLSRYFLSSLPGQAGLLEPFLKRNRAAVPKLFLVNCIENPKCMQHHVFSFLGRKIGDSHTLPKWVVSFRGVSHRSDPRGAQQVTCLWLPSLGFLSSGLLARDRAHRSPHPCFALLRVQSMQGWPIFQVGDWRIVFTPSLC